MKHHFGHFALVIFLVALVSSVSTDVGVQVAQSNPYRPTPDKLAPEQDDKFWIGETGPTGPIFTGPHQYPFICSTVENGLGQPLVDNLEGIGNAVFPESDGVPDFNARPEEIVGYSKNCSIPTRVHYFYFSEQAGEFLPLLEPTEVPADVEKISLNGKMINFVIRVEIGTINRFLYSIAMLAPFPESLEDPQALNNSAWNKKLAYMFLGGAGIGHWQGELDLTKDEVFDEAEWLNYYQSLKRGYAVAYSTGTRTSTHYNLRLAEETALMVKRHFVATYGRPGYTVGIGGSGGAVQQYVIGQNNHRIIDAAVAQLSFPDMITQSVYLGDCELLERYFDNEFGLDSSSKWGDWHNRSLIEGLVANNTAFKLPWSLSPFAPSPGSSECISWRGFVQRIVNPAWADLEYFPAWADVEYFKALELYRYPPEVVASIKWTHWNDLANIYPQDENGIAPNTLDNVGIQYGLRALVNGDITVQEFLDLNACVGGWKPPQEMVLGDFPWNPATTLDPWDQKNMNLSASCKEQKGQPAPRTEGDITAMNAAYTSGHVFTGDLRIPVIDLRWYLDPVLDRHHTQATFAARGRMIDRLGDAANHVVWIAECSNLNPITLDFNCAFNPTGEALEIIDQWLTNIEDPSLESVIRGKPTEAVDACFNGDGSVKYAGPDAWDGLLNEKPQGPCAMAFPIYSTSRIEAGGDMKGNVFKCGLKSVETALVDGTYAGVAFSETQKTRLKEIFPMGVCDYSKPDVGLP